MESQPPPPSIPTARLWRLRSVFREDRLFFLLAIVIGLCSGIAVVCFRVSIDRAHDLLLGSSFIASRWRLLVAPSAIGLLVGIIVAFVFPTTRGSGVNQTKAALYVYNGYISFRTVIGKFICAALAIGAGHSLGPEDPSLQIGAGIASVLGRYLKLSRDKGRLIAPIGAAAGLAAAFNAPISAVLFVIEEVIGRWSAGVLGAVVLSAIASTVVERSLLGYAPLFSIPTFAGFRPAELLAYGALGVAGGFASVVFAKAISMLRPKLIALPRWTHAVQPAIAGLLTGMIGYLGFPQVMGAGYEFVDQAIHNQFTWQMLGILAGLKILATTISFVSGTPGGMFAPTLFIGAMLGGFVGGVERIAFPHLAGSSAAYALVGIGVLFAGFLRAPMTSVFMVLEVSGNYSIIVPVIIANTIAYLISRSLQPVPLFDMLSRQDGLDLPSMEEEREMTVVRVEDAMLPAPETVLGDNMIVEEALKRAQNSPTDVLLVRRSPSGWSTVRKDDLKRLVGEGKPEMTLMSALSSKLVPVLHPDHPLDTALHYIYDCPLLPVVHRADLHRLEGILTMADILRAYRGVGAEPADAPQIP